MGLFTKLTITAVGMLLLLALANLAPAKADLFTGGTAFTVNTTGTPGGGGNDPALFTIATPLPNAGLLVTSTDTPGGDRPGAEWVIFNYTSDGSIAPSQGNWAVNEVGLQINHPAFLIRGFVQLDIGGINQAFNTSPFSNFTPVSSGPISFLPGPGLLGALNPDTNPADAFPAGPLPSLGSFFDPFSQLNGDFTNGAIADQINSYTEALEFAPAGTVGGVPETSTWAMGLIGFGLMGAFSFRRLRLRTLNCPPAEA
jgi:hypothetical protein